MLLVAGFHNFGTIEACDETHYDLSIFFDGEKVLYYDYQERQTVKTLPDFADPVVVPDLSKPASRAQNTCKQALAILSEAHMNPPEELGKLQLKQPFNSIKQAFKEECCIESMYGVSKRVESLWLHPLRGRNTTIQTSNISI